MKITAHKIIAVLTTLLLPALATAVNMPPKPDASQIEAVKNGETIVEAVNQDNAGAAMWIMGRIDAPAKNIFDAIVECKRAPEYHKDLKECRNIERQSDYDIVYHAVKYLWFIPKQEYIFRADYQGHTQVRFHMIEGDMKVMEGGWDMYPLDQEDSYAVRYYLNVRPGIYVPKWAVRRTLKKTLPELLDIMERLAQNPELLSDQDTGSD